MNNYKHTEPQKNTKKDFDYRRLRQVEISVVLLPFHRKMTADLSDATSQSPALQHGCTRVAAV